MVIMGMQARKEYRGVVRERYWKARSKKEKTRLLDEYCANTGHARKYAIRRLGARDNPDEKRRKRRKPVYDGEEFQPRQILPIGLSYDHRANDGADAARFVRWLRTAAEDPLTALLEGGA